MEAPYKQDLAYIQATAFGDLAKGAAPEIIRRLKGAPTPIVRAQSDLMPGGGSELFQMCLQVFLPKDKLLDVLRTHLIGRANRDRSRPGSPRRAAACSCSDAQHGVVEVIAMEQAVMEMLPELGVGQHFGMPLAQRFADCHKKTAGSTGWVANDVRGLGLNHLHHQPDDVARRAELSILPAEATLPSMYS